MKIEREIFQLNEGTEFTVPEGSIVQEEARKSPRDASPRMPMIVRLLEEEGKTGRFRFAFPNDLRDWWEPSFSQRSLVVFVPRKLRAGDKLRIQLFDTNYAPIRRCAVAVLI